MRNGKSVIIGAGNTTYDLIEYMRQLGNEFADNFFICLDNNSSLWGTKLEGVMVSAVDEIRKYPDTDIIISSIYEKDIRQQLEKLNISNPIMNYVDYKRMIFADYQIRNYHAMHPQIKRVKQNIIKELTVYTAVFDGYDSLRDMISSGQNVRYVCFTDDRTLRSDVWEIIYVDREYDDPILESRKYKMLPHLFINTEYSLYIDANVQFVMSPLDYVNQYLMGKDMLFVPHPVRDCIYQEMATCILLNKDFPQRLVDQVSVYSNYNCPEHSGLFYGGVIGRRHFEKEVVKFDNEWWNHFQQYSRRDQISLGYLIWKNHAEISLANIDCYNNKWFVVDEKHGKNNKE